jgi:very-short-patch-repair endonuclease
MPGSIRNTSRTARDRARELRSGMGETERMLWSRLRRRAIGFRFRRQYPIGPYIIDFYCHEALLAVEVDGEFHDRPERTQRDAQRDAELRSKGVEVLRFRTVDVIESMDAVLERIHAVCRERTA